MTTIQTIPSLLQSPSSEPADAAAELTLREQFYAFEEIQRMTESDRDALFTLLRKAQQGDPSSLETVFRHAYEERPVPIDEFILGKRYLGLRGQINHEKLDILARADHPRVLKIWLAIGKGGGKSFIVSIMLARIVYKLLCLRRPDLFYMLGPGSGIAALNLSVSKEQARDVVYAEFKGRLEHCPWFRSKGWKPFKYHAIFPKKIAVFTQSKNPNVSFGYNTIFASMDECAHMLDNEEKSMAEDLYDAVLGSLNSRFPNAYKFMGISTLRDTDDFLNTNVQRIKEAGYRVKP